MIAIVLTSFIVGILTLFYLLIEIIKMEREIRVIDKELIK